MKKNYLLLIVGCFIMLYTHAQDRTNFNKNYEPIKTELTNWDPVRGLWLSNSIERMARKQQVPDRTFPESYTPNQMLNRVPKDVRTRIATIARTNVDDPNDGPLWTSVDELVAFRSCTSVGGRTYGDPHLVSYDGARYSFQTVGEFVFTKSNDGEVEVQSRQKPLGEDFSLNTAIAMNVGGDRVCIYASDYPDRYYSTPVRVNGEAVQVGNGSYFLPNGGTVRFTRNTYVVDWPTGESLDARMSSTQGMRFIDVNMKVFPCSNQGYYGLMGNANGIQSDDFNTRTGVSPFDFTSNVGLSSADSKRARQQYLSKEFAEDVRITQAESLFDYSPGESTFTFTDRTFPRFYRTIDDLTDVQRSTARRRCQEGGVSAADMNGCIYDNGFLAIEPSVPPVITDPSVGTVLKPIDRPSPNVNPRPSVGKETEVTKPSGYGAQPLERLRTEKKKTEVSEPTTSKPRLRWTSSDDRNDNDVDVEETKPSSTPSSTKSWRSTSPSSTPRSTPTRSTPTRSTPTRSTPTRSTPTRSTPTRSTPTRSTPTRSTPKSSGGIRGRG